MMVLEGPILWIGQKTVDRRLITSLSVTRLPLPVLALDESVNPVGYSPVGKITDVTITADSLIAAVVVAKVEVPEWIFSGYAKEDAVGKFNYCAIDVDIDPRNSEFVSAWEDPWSDPDAYEKMSGRLMAVTLHQEPGAFPGAKLRPIAL